MFHFSEGPDKQWLGLILFVIGGIILLQRLDVIPQETWGYFWPLLLIFIGIKLMTGQVSSTRMSPKKAAPKLKKRSTTRKRIAKKK